MSYKHKPFFERITFQWFLTPWAWREGQRCQTLSDKKPSRAYSIWVWFWSGGELLLVAVCGSSISRDGWDVRRL